MIKTVMVYKTSDNQFFKSVELAEIYERELQRYITNTTIITNHNGEVVNSQTLEMENAYVCYVGSEKAMYNIVKQIAKYNGGDKYNKEIEQTYYEMYENENENKNSKNNNLVYFEDIHDIHNKNDLYHFFHENFKYNTENKILNGEKEFLFFYDDFKEKFTYITSEAALAIWKVVDQLKTQEGTK